MAPPELRAQLEAGTPASPDGLVPRESEPLTTINEHDEHEAEQKNPLDDARHDLRNYCLKMIDQLKLIEELQDNFRPEGDDGLGKISKAVRLTFAWYMGNEENTDMDLFRFKQRTLEQLVNPILNKLYNEVYGGQLPGDCRHVGGHRQRLGCLEHSA